MSLIDLDHLTRGERLVLARRRAGMSQAASAGILGMSVARYRRLEQSDDPDTPRVCLETLTPGEQCFVMRRRHGLKVTEVAELTGFTPRWIRRVEAGDTRGFAPMFRWWQER